MRGLLSRVLVIGADRADDEDTRLRKLLLLVTALTMTPLSVLWGLLYWLAGNPMAALIAWTYVGVSFIGLSTFAATRRYPWFAASQFTPYMILPFVLMWALGGPISGSAVHYGLDLGRSMPSCSGIDGWRLSSRAHTRRWYMSATSLQLP